MIPLHAPNISVSDIEIIKKTLKSGWVSSSGQLILKFEQNLAKFSGAKYCVAVSSGTTALHLALLSLDIKKNEEVIVPSITFIAPINAVKYVNANPIFMDSDNDLNIDVSKVIDFINKETSFKNGSTFNKKTKKIIKAIIVVHIFGNPVDLEKITKICKNRNIEIIEDSAEGLGSSYIKGRYKNKHVGTIGRVGCLSFNGNKIITTGSGGAIITNSKKIADKIRYLSTQAKTDGINYIHDDVGYNYRMPNLLASLGISQLSILNKFLKSKINNHKLYCEYFKELNGLEILEAPRYARSNYWLNILRLNKKVDKNFIKSMVNYLNKIGIQVRPVWYPNHLQKPFIKYQRYKIINANKLFKNCICLPSSNNITKKEIKFIFLEIKRYLQKNSY
tara:strand:+ start:2397 stop:3569 length:1173 start_codon:yes stop_codon:yes gene_type:complete